MLWIAVFPKNYVKTSSEVIVMTGQSNFSSLDSAFKSNLYLQIFLWDTLAFWNIDNLVQCLYFPWPHLLWTVILQVDTLTGLLMQGLTYNLPYGLLGGKLSDIAVLQKMKYQQRNHLLQREEEERGEKSPNQKSRRRYAVNFFCSLFNNFLS